jgi:hypothetical protein
VHFLVSEQYRSEYYSNKLKKKTKCAQNAGQFCDKSVAYNVGLQAHIFPLRAMADMCAHES